MNRLNEVCGGTQAGGPHARLHALLATLRRVVGAEYVSAIGKFSPDRAATFDSDKECAWQVAPGCVGELRQCVRLASHFQQSIYPVSCGLNWGLGSRAPAGDSAILVDLSRMNRIVDFDEELGYITVEPGVSFQQVYKFLRDRKSQLFVAVIGGAPGASIIGNTVERGNGIGPYADRAASVCGLEVVLPGGECIHTGFKRYAHARTASVSRHGVGPALDGLFLQSNFGIVSQLSIWLRPRPARLQTFLARIHGHEDLPVVIDEMRRLIMTGALGDFALGFWNSYKVLARLGSYPWVAMQGETPLGRGRLNSGLAWFASGAIYAPSDGHAQAATASLQRALAQAPAVALHIDNIDPLSDDSLYLGVPSDANLRSMYWRKVGDPPPVVAPERDRCGVIWLCPLLPFVGSVCASIVERIEASMLAMGFEPNIGFSCQNPRAIEAYVGIMYDRDVPGEDQRAMRCHDHLFEMLQSEGVLPFRLGIQSMHLLWQPDDDYPTIMQTLKQALDPSDILAPGRYDFRGHWRGGRKSQEALLASSHQAAWAADGEGEWRLPGVL
jgi:4-cresol dehydrogenase (hydroxylating)